MGRKRRDPIDEKDAKELERLRRNQAACRQKKLDKCDEYKNEIDILESNLKQKFQLADHYMQSIHELRRQLDVAQNTYFGDGWRSQNELTLDGISQRIQSIQRDIETIKNSSTTASDWSKRSLPDVETSQSDGHSTFQDQGLPSTSRDH